MKWILLIALVQIFPLTHKGLMLAANYGGASLLFAWVRTEIGWRL